MTTALPGHVPPPVDASVVSDALARSRLGGLAVRVLMLCAVAPILVLAGVVSNVYGVSGITSIPAAFAVVAVVLALFGAGYAAMARRIVHAGALYSFISRLGRPVGVGAALVALAAYNLLQISLYGLFGPVMSSLLEAKAGVAAPWWACSLAAWALVTAMGLARIDVNARVLTLLLAAEAVIVAVYVAVMLAHPAESGWSTATLDPTDLLAPGAGAVLVAAVLGSIGFEHGPVYAEESRDPERTGARATYTVIGLIGVTYVAASWAMSVAAGPDRIASYAAEHQERTMFALVAPHLPPAMIDIGLLLMLGSVFTALGAYHHASARYAYALGREHVLPGVLGVTSRRTKSPKWASLAQSGLGLAAIVAYAAAGLDPLLDGFFVGGLLGGFGVLTLLAACAVAVAWHLTRHHLTEVGRWRALIAPGLAAVALTYMTWQAARHFGPLVGLPEGSPLAWQLPSGYAVAAAVGAGWALWLRARRPHVYAGIGLGPHADLGAHAASGAIADQRQGASA